MCCLFLGVVYELQHYLHERLPFTADVTIAVVSQEEEAQKAMTRTHPRGAPSSRQAGKPPFRRFLGVHEVDTPPPWSSHPPSHALQKKRRAYSRLPLALRSRKVCAFRVTSLCPRAQQWAQQWGWNHHT